MGRVRRYKAVKACDPFAKRRQGATGKRKKQKEMDLAPEQEEDGETFAHEEEVPKKSQRNRERRWARQALGLEDEAGEMALRLSRPHSTSFQAFETTSPAKKVVITPKAASETQSQFRQRLRREGAKFMKEAVDATSATKARRKIKAQERKIHTNAFF